jgi:hypothetical protein
MGYQVWVSVLIEPMLIVLVLLALVWLCAVVVVIAACQMAARGDGELDDASHSPRRPSTCGTVRSRILMSPHNDQLATYR